MKEVRKNLTAFYKAFEETKVFVGSHYYPFKVSGWLCAFEANEINMNRLMGEYCNGTSNEPTWEQITPLSMVKKFEQLAASEK